MMRRIACGILILMAVGAGTRAAAQTVTAVTPGAQRVTEYIELTGSGFGTTQGASRVRFTSGTVTVEAGTAYLWRDNYIRIAVPVGNRISGVITPIPKTPLSVFVQTAAGTSNMLPFQVISTTTGTLSFRQLTNIGADFGDTSIVLGSPPHNSGRTKDAEIGDVNNDGWPDLIDNNSNNVQNSTHSILRINNHDRSFTARLWEPNSSSDSGTFAVSIGAGGDFFGDQTSYDADFADITGDRLPDLIHTAADNTGGGAPARMRLLINGAGGVPGAFTEDTAARMPANALGTNLGCPDDVDHADIDNDGDIDFAVTLRTATGFCSPSSAASQIRVFVNNGTGTFGAPIVLDAPAQVSTHDVRFVDANADGFQDLVMCNEFSFGAAAVEARLWLNNANPASPGFTAGNVFPTAATTTAAADFNGDGLPDLLLGRTSVKLYLNQPAAPGTFTESTVFSGAGNDPFYDFEVGDLNLDGWPDFVAVIVTSFGTDKSKIWINNGDATFTEITAASTVSVLPGHVTTMERLSADLLDLDRDGDLDLYLTGNDGTDRAPSGSGFGRGPNQLYENLMVGLDLLYPRQITPAYAGSAAGGRKVLVRLATPVPAATLTAASFTVTVDGTDLAAAATVTGGRVADEFWMLVQMPAKADGCYPLSVRLASDPGILDLEPASLCYEAERQFDRALAIDRTGSMLWDSTANAASPEKMEAARAAATFFVDLSADVDKIGVTSFQRDSDDGDGVVEQIELARTDFGMVAAQDGATDNRAGARTAVAGVAPGGPGFASETAIGAGVRQALTMLETSAAPGHEREIVLITDGRENYPPYWNQAGDGGPLRPVLLAASPPVAVHAIAIGNDASAQLMQDIAASTGGLFFNLYEGTGSYGLMSRLASVYKFIDEEMRDEQRFFYREGVPAATPSGFGGGSEIASHAKYVRQDSFYVPPGFESISVGFHWNVPGAVSALVLRAPDGTPIVHAPPLRSLHADDHHRTYRIADPAPGWYTYVLPAATSESIEFFATVSGITDLLAKGRLGTVEPAAPGSYRVPVRVVIGDTAPVLHASVHGHLSRPDHTKVPISLADDGAHADARNLDAIYGVELTETQPGGYFITLEATGVSSDGQPFTRHLMFSFVVPGAPDPDETPDNLRDPDGRGGDGPGRGLALSFHVGSTHPLRTLDDAFDANIYLRLDAQYRLTPRLSVIAMAGLAQLTAEPPAEHRWWMHGSLDAQARTRLGSGIWTFVQAGPGVYRRKAGGASPGFNVGFGGQVPLAGGPFLLEFGIDYHRLFGEDQADLLTAQLGVVFAWGRAQGGKQTVISSRTRPSTRPAATASSDAVKRTPAGATAP